MTLSSTQAARKNEIIADISESTTLTAQQKSDVQSALNVLISMTIGTDWLDYAGQSVEYIGGSRPTKPHTPS